MEKYSQNDIKSDIMLTESKMTERKEKLLRKFINSPNSISIQEVIMFLSYSGYTLDRITGSHFIFKNEQGLREVIPSHHWKVKKSYIKKLINL